MGLKVVALTGAGGKMAAIADTTVAVPSNNTQYVQEGHLAVEHLLCALVESYIYENKLHGNKHGEKQS